MVIQPDENVEKTIGDELSLVTIEFKNPLKWKVNMILTHPCARTLRNLITHPWQGLALVVGLAGCLALTPVQATSAWTATLHRDPVTRQSRCLLVSETLATSDGYDSTPVYLLMDGVNLQVVTESELDTSFNDLRLEVDTEPPVYSNQITHKKMILVFDQDTPKLIEQFRGGQKVTVHLRFWPTWPTTQSFPIQFSLIGFSKAHDSFAHGCQPTS